MITIETKHHITHSGEDRNPEWVCGGACQKVWWNEDLENWRSAIGESTRCPKCDGRLSQAIEIKHFNVLRKWETPKNQGAKIGHASIVKPEYEELAKKWK